MAHLARTGWRICPSADTASLETGADVLAGKGARMLAVAVRGLPRRFYTDPRHAGEAMPTNPSVQARHWYAAAVLTAMHTRDQHPTYEIGMAFPDAVTYRSLRQRTAASLAVLGIRTLFVAADGQVTEVPQSG